MDSTLRAITHSLPLACLSASASNSPSKTSTIERAETGVPAKLEASRDSRIYMRARSLSVTIPTSTSPSSTMGTWPMFLFAMASPTLRKGSFLWAVTTSFITSFTRSLI
jgi:hypothetical protein